MASNPMLQAVLLFQNHQTTTPYFPVKGVPIASTSATEPIQTADMAKPKEEKTEDEAPFDTEEENDEENGEDDKEEEGESNA